ncbi:ribosome maturation factor RimP [Anaeromicrobium sediminis]|uniref:Ribosome maturation factor RimP n=1 Tax=Anaeromicrobium sediminis TaxID=1478221 RepID=A0A267MNS5_9FIRM|nr:ribosome maturation factor RimP [Anaeromicrobium sediminis]PAB61229.1 ribosome maturation factor RimP [Anaeromicrobium sediminis]
MSKKRTVEIVEELAIPIIEENKFELVDVEFVKEGPHWFLRLYIDKDGGIGLDDCQLVSEKISKKLDEVDPIEHNYYLEVSSPGIDRPLKKDKDFEKYKGEQIEVFLYAPYEGKKVLQGELLGLENNEINIKDENNNIIKIERSKVSKVKLAVIF